jgi:hypothetical protein
MVAIPMAIPTIARAALVLFLNGFFTISDKNDINCFHLLKILLKS